METYRQRRSAENIHTCQLRQREVEIVFCTTCFHLCVADWSNVTDGHVSISEVMWGEDIHCSCMCPCWFNKPQIQYSKTLKPLLWSTIDLPHVVHTDSVHTFHAIVGEALAELIHHDEADAERIVGPTYFLQEENGNMIQDINHPNLLKVNSLDYLFSPSQILTSACSFSQ